MQLNDIFLLPRGQDVFDLVDWLGSGYGVFTNIFYVVAEKERLQQCKTVTATTRKIRRGLPKQIIRLSDTKVVILVSYVPKKKQKQSATFWPQCIQERRNSRQSPNYFEPQ